MKSFFAMIVLLILSASAQFAAADAIPYPSPNGVAAEASPGVFVMPEPRSLALLGTGLAGLAFVLGRRKPADGLMKGNG